MQVTGYYVYFAEADGSLRSLLGNTTEDVHQIDFPSDQPTGTLSTILVYASSSLAEQTTPLALAFNDTDSSVSSINFPDRDLDADEIGAGPSLPILHWWHIMRPRMPKGAAWEGTNS